MNTLDGRSKLFYDDRMEMQPEFYRAYFIHGEGGVQAVQARLARHGLCSYTKWDPGPPLWRLTYDTYLSKAELESMLNDLINRYSLRIEIKSAP